MPLEQRSRVGPYELVTRIGAGGMGEVWRGKDTRLDRSVAVKILPEEFAQDAVLRARFQREAKTISQLSHPHICTLFDIGDNYLVMELLEGETLGERLQRGPLPLSEVLRYGIQIAEALDRAHRSGVIHRDLKPANIMITRGGAKLLDFGLAKGAPLGVSSEGPTEHQPLTEEGMLLGTFQYMAPELLEGADADARSDIFAFGAVLYEMATGQHAFAGKTKASLIASIMTADPPSLSALQPLTPPAVEHVVRRCLEKDPSDRWQSAHDVAEELRWISQTGSQAAIARPAVASKQSRLPMAIALMLLAAALGGASFLAWRSEEPKPVIEAAIPTDGSSGLEYFSGPPALSPDGRLLVFAARDAEGRRMLWLRPIDGSSRVVPGTVDAEAPFWSPDGRQIGFFADGRLKKIAAAGGDPEILTNVQSVGGSWGRDGTILFTSRSGGAIYRVSAAGGEPVVVTDPPKLKHRAHRWPYFLPDGKHFLFLALAEGRDSQERQQIYVASLDGNEAPRPLLHATSNVAYVDPGYILFVRAGVLRAQRFDAEEGELQGEPAAIAPVQQYAWNSAGLFTVAPNGLLVYQRRGNVELSELVVKNRKGEVVWKFAEAGYYFTPRLSHDGKMIAVDKSDAAGQGDIWVVDIDRQTSTRVTFDARNETAPHWSPDDREIAFTMNHQSSTGGAFRKPVEGGTTQTILDIANTNEAPTDWSPDGTHVAYIRYAFAQRNDGDIAAIRLTDRKTIEIASSAADEQWPQFSPDGKWVVYHSDESGRYEVYVQPFPPNGAKYQVSTTGGFAPRWSRTGEIFFLSTGNRLFSARVATEPAFRSGTPEPLFNIDPRDNRWAQYDIAPDGSILVNGLRREPRPMTLVVNWMRKIAE